MNGKVTYGTLAEMECHRLKAFLMCSIGEVHPGADLVRVNLAKSGKSRYLNMRYVNSYIGRTIRVEPRSSRLYLWRRFFDEKL